MSDQDMDRCWICLTGHGEDPPPGVTLTEFKRPCDCKLVAHESCLLEWANSQKSSGNHEIDCPQCKAKIRVVKLKKSSLLHLRDLVEKLNRTGFQFMLFSTATGTLFGVVYTGLYCAGASAIRMICPPRMALDLLGIVIGPDTVQLLPQSWRKMILIPTIPFVLLSAGARSTKVDLATALLPFALFSKQNFSALSTLSAPQITLAILPWIRIAYQRLYSKFVDPFILQCAYKIRPSFQPEQEQPPLLNIRLVANGPNGDRIEFNNNNADDAQDRQGIEEGADQEQVNNMAEPEADEIAAQLLADAQEQNGGGVDEDDGLFMRMLLGGMDWLINMMEPPVHDGRQQPELPNGEGGGGNRAPPPRQEQQLAVRNQGPVPHAGDWVVSERSLTSRVGNAFIWPLLGASVGGVISSIPLVRKTVPDRFTRNILGALLVVAGRDLINVATAAMRVREENSRIVLNRDE